MDHEALVARQQQLEAEGLAEGARLFRQRLEAAQKGERSADVGAMRKLAQMAIDPLADALSQLMEQSRGRKGRKHQVERFVSALGPEVVAFLTVKSVMNTIVLQNRRVSWVAQEIAGKIEDEMRFRRLREEAPGLFQYRMDHFNTSSYDHKARALSAALHHADIVVDDLALPAQVKLAIGVKLIDLLRETTQLFEIHSKVSAAPGRRSRPTTETVIVPTAEMLSWIDTRNGALEFMQPCFMPMVVPPAPWLPGFTHSGGYRFALRCRASLARHASKSQVAMLKTAEMPVVFQALNAIQATPWKINPNTYRLIEAIVNVGGRVASIPALDDEAMPPKPHDIANNTVERKAWRKRAHKIKEKNFIRRLASLTFHAKWNVAKRMKDDPQIYFPCSLDFRGRIYPITHHLTPQGDDLSKALLMFSEGKPLGDGGEVWLALHGANCLGTTPDGVKLSRSTLQERVDWIVNNTAIIERVASDPLGNTWWSNTETVDDPFQFFAFCGEWAGYAKLARQGRGSEYVCALPVAMDGTCNGLQHFAAMLCDERGGAAVNVVPSERPQDVYQQIADAVLEVLELRASSDDMARRWLSSGLVGRKLCKRPTMTFGYGSKRFGFQQQLTEYLKSEHPASIPAFFTETTDDGKVRALTLPACAYMGGLIWDALQVVVVSASEGMRWMQDVSRLIAKQGKCATWTVPGTGFPVHQNYMVQTEHKIETILSGKIFRPTIYRDSTVPNPNKQANAISPNVVHSLDAAALMLTVTRCVDAGVSAFAMIHDSYGTHAADAGILARETREAFIQLYETHDVLNTLAFQWFNQAPAVEKWPELPKMGTLKLSDIRSSFYFFS